MPAPVPHLHSGSRLLIAERFVAPCALLTHVLLPLDVIARSAPARLRLVVATGDGVAPQQRVVTLSSPPIEAGALLRLAFAPLEAGAGATFVIGALDTASATRDEDDFDVAMVRAAAAGREPIVLECGGPLPPIPAPGNTDAPEILLPDEQAITATLTGRPSTTIPTAHWLDVFWCDASGIYLKGWVHAFENRIRQLQFESAGHCVRVEGFFERPDLLVHYPQYDHVRHSGFAAYLPAPAGHPVTMVVETDRGTARVPFPLPDGPLPAWPVSESDGDEVSPTLRRFAALINREEGPILQIGSRTPPGVDPVPPRTLFARKVIGLDIHPGCHVDLVGDAHVLSRFIRPRSMGAVLSMSLLEHVHAPWVVAAEINRVLRPGGVVYHHAPGAWPAHAQPNDFWRFSAEGLSSLFGSAAGFEVIEACDSGHAAMIPAPQWRKHFLEMPATPLFGMAEIVARKVRDLEPGEVAWPLSGADASRAQRYPLDGLRPKGELLS
ncbi:MAG: methyltransferase domain-containing protein [Thermoanaerobaculia bacterium]